MLLNKEIFKKQTKKEWRKLVNIKELKHKNKHNVYDPVYFDEEVIASNTFKKSGDWDICVKIFIKDEKTANKQAHEALLLGANSITFTNINNHNLIEILRNIKIDIVKINFENFKSCKNIIEQLIDFSHRNNINHKKIQGAFNQSTLSKSKYLLYSSMLPEYRFIANPVYSVNFSQLDTITHHKYIKQKHITYKFNISNIFLFEISKIRSFRIAYNKKYNSEPDIQCIINLQSDKAANLIESSIKATSAIIGGCSSLMIASKQHNTSYIKQQLILKHESYLDCISDPTHGSYYIEHIAYSLNKIEQQEIKNKNTNIWETAEEIPLKSKYYKNDINNIAHLGFGVGIEPYIRGPYASMYCDKKWTIRQYAGFSTAKESNLFYKKNLKSGQTGLSVAFDLATHRGYDSDHHRVFGDVGKAGVAIDSIEDMAVLFQGIDLSSISVSMTMNGAIIPIMAFFIGTAKKNNIPLNQLTGTIQNDILKEFMVRNTYIYPPKPSMRIVSDIFKYTSKNMPKFNNISVSGYHMLEAGASADIELAYTLSDGLEYIRTGINAGLKIDDFAPRLSFFWGIGMNLFMEIAKMRAGRILWAEMMKEFNPKNPKSTMLRAHCQTSGWSLTAQDPHNNITRTTIEAIAAILGGTQSLHTNALDEAMSLPTEYSAKIARDTQIYLQKETDLSEVIDPFGGSYYLESLTEELLKKAKKHINEIEKIGGMAQAIETGLPKLKIETSAIKRQAKIDNKDNLIIGVNCFQEKQENNFDILDIDNEKVQKIQIKNIKHIKNNRDEIVVKNSLTEITNACANENINLLEVSIKAALKHATLGEISQACEKVFKRYSAITNIVSGIYGTERKHDTNFILAKKLSHLFKKKYGRQPRILTAKLGQDGHDRGIKIISTSFADMGFDVDIAPLFQTPNEIAKQGIENDVHVIGISSLAGGHKTLIPELINQLKKINREDIIIIAGGVIPKQDYKTLYDSGVKQIFGPGTIVSEACVDILNKLLEK